MKPGILRVALAAVLLLAAAAAFRVVMSNLTPVRPVPGAGSPADAGKAAHPSLLYGRVTMSGGKMYEGRLRFGGDQEAFWGDAFNGQRSENLWVRHVPPGRLRRTTHPVSILGAEVAEDEDEVPLTRPMMARLGDLARIEVNGRRIEVTLKSGAVMDVDYDEANDFDDGVRVWDAREGVLDLNAQWIKVIEFLPAPEPASGPAPARLYGVMRTRGGEFKGFIQWNRRASLADDTLHVGAREDDADIRFGRVRAIVRRSPTSASVVLDDGTEVQASEPGDVGRATGGAYVEDPRYGRVLVRWDMFERVDFSEGGPGPSYRDFAPGGPTRGRVIANDGRALEGRLVFDLDESEVTETLDAPAKGIDYSIPFTLVAAIDLAGRDGAALDRVAVTLVSGEALGLDRSGDLSPSNGGLLVFGDDGVAPQYLQWAEVRRIEIGSPAPSGSR